MTKFYWITLSLISIVMLAYFAFHSRRSWRNRAEMKELGHAALKQFLAGFFFCACLVSLKILIGIGLSQFYFFEFQNLNLTLIAIAVSDPLLVALFEEIISRGLLFGALLWLFSKLGDQAFEKRSILMAIILQAFIFTYLHDYHLSVSASNLSHFSFGIIAALFTWRTKALWMAIGFHFSWNFFQKLSHGIAVDYLPRLSGLVTIEANLPLIGTYLTCTLAMVMIIHFFISSAKPNGGTATEKMY